MNDNPRRLIRHAFFRRYVRVKVPCLQVTADVRFSNVDKFSNVYKSSNGAYLNLATVLEPQIIGCEAL